jgi:hypothetical protein
MRTAPNFAGKRRPTGPAPSHAPQSPRPAAEALSQLTWPAVQDARTPVGPGDVFEGAVLFRQLRHLVQLPIEHIAYRLGTTIEVLQALEHGQTAALPPWPETVRVVTAYTGFATIDPRPVLSSIHAAMTARHHEEVRLSAAIEADRMGRTAGSARNPMRGNAGVEGDANDETAGPLTRAYDAALNACQAIATKVWSEGAVDSLKQRRVIAGLAITLPLALIMSLASGGPVQAVASVLPRPVTGFFKSIEDFMRVSMAPRREGFVWIEGVDPRTRKTDKLPSPKR